jgi:AraC-like DNA-binding protein
LLIWLNHSLQELADEIGLNLKKLKMGFKQIYGDTVYGFLFDYKMDLPENYLTGSYNVNEVGLKIGYSTGSHFIAAFKRNLLPPKKIFNVNKPKYVINH